MLFSKYAILELYLDMDDIMMGKKLLSTARKKFLQSNGYLDGPFEVVVNVINRCNLNCNYCYAHANQDKRYINVDSIKIKNGYVNNIISWTA